MARRILIVEDEPIVALNYASILADEGYDVVGPVSTIGKGIEAINREHLDGAVLDIDIAGVPVDPIVAALRQAYIPYIFVSAFSDKIGLYADAEFLEKPCTAAQLVRAVDAMLLPARSASSAFDPGAWNPATLQMLRQALAVAAAMHQRELRRQRDGGKAALASAARSVADLALTGVRDRDRLINYARLAIESSLPPEDMPPGEGSPT
jgi:DNA-binding response OmpR family regulator